MALDCLVAIELRVAVMVGSQALAYQAKVPTTYWIRFTRPAEMYGDVSRWVV